MFCSDLTTIVIGSEAQALVGQIVCLLKQNTTSVLICASAYEAAAIIFSNNSSKFMVIGDIKELMLENGKLFEIIPVKSRIIFCCVMQKNRSFDSELLADALRRGVYFVTAPQQVKDIWNGLTDRGGTEIHEPIRSKSFGQKMTRLADNFFITHAESDALKGYVRNAV